MIGDDWRQASERHALALFRRAAARVPAYAAFLRDHRCDPSAVETPADFRCVPVTTKSNYVDRFPLPERMWDGSLASAVLMNASSGTSGVPYYWPCDSLEIDESAAFYDSLFRTQFAMGERRTLLVICFGMGTWIAGSYTLHATLGAARAGMPVTVVTPGFDKAETLAVLRQLAPDFEQVVLAGIPSFLKDLVDEWAAVPGPRPPVRFFLAGEGFTEAWRGYVRDRTAAAGIVSVLGSADAGVMAFESPATVRLRQRATADEATCFARFGRPTVPAVFRYRPTHRFFEAIDGELAVTARRAMPLIRYSLHDEGGLLDPLSDSDDPAAALPVVYVFGRGRFGVMFYGIPIGPDDVQPVLLSAAVAPHVSGRFRLTTELSANADPRLRIDVELSTTFTPSNDLANAVAEEFITAVAQRRSEFRRLRDEYGDRCRPLVTLHPPATGSFAPPGSFRKNS